MAETDAVVGLAVPDAAADVRAVGAEAAAGAEIVVVEDPDAVVGVAVVDAGVEGISSI